jgi:DNA-binding response OmpR family regulator
VQILIVEDDDAVADALRAVLQHHGHRCARVSRGDDALLRHGDADLVLLDLGLADGDGFEVLRRLRQVSDVPVLVASARSDERSIVRALHLGADDFCVKPVRMAELMARIGVVTRRQRLDVAPEDASQVVAGDVVIDLAARAVTVAGDRVALTTKEFGVLEALARRAGEAVRKEQVLDEVWGDTSVGASRSCDVHLVQLRAKLDRPDLIRTIRGFGYRLEV